MGPYEIVTTSDNGSVEVKKIDDSQVYFVLNGHRLRLYHKPISKQDFLQYFSQREVIKLVEGEVSSPSPSSWSFFGLSSFVYM